MSDFNTYNRDLYIYGELIQKIKERQAAQGVSSVNAKTGDVLLNTDDIPEGLLHKYMTDEELENLADVEGERFGVKTEHGYKGFVSKTPSINLYNGISYNYDLTSTNPSSISNGWKCTDYIDVHDHIGKFFALTISDSNRKIVTGSNVAYFVYDKDKVPAKGSDGKIKAYSTVDGFGELKASFGSAGYEVDTYYIRVQTLSRYLAGEGYLMYASGDANALPMVEVFDTTDPSLISTKYVPYTGTKNVYEFANNHNTYTIYNNMESCTWTWWNTLSCTDSYGNSYISYISKRGYAGVAMRMPNGKILCRDMYKTETFDDHNACAVALLSDETLLVMGSTGHSSDDVIHILYGTKPCTVDCEFVDKSVSMTDIYSNKYGIDLTAEGVSYGNTYMQIHTLKALRYVEFYSNMTGMSDYFSGEVSTPIAFRISGDTSTKYDMIKNDGTTVSYRKISDQSWTIAFTDGAWQNTNYQKIWVDPDNTYDHPDNNTPYHMGKEENASFDGWITRYARCIYDDDIYGIFRASQSNGTSSSSARGLIKTTYRRCARYPGIAVDQTSEGSSAISYGDFHLYRLSQPDNYILSKAVEGSSNIIRLMSCMNVSLVDAATGCAIRQCFLDLDSMYLYREYFGYGNTHNTRVVVGGSNISATEITTSHKFIYDASIMLNSNSDACMEPVIPAEVGKTHRILDVAVTVPNKMSAFYASGSRDDSLRKLLAEYAMDYKVARILKDASTGTVSKSSTITVGDSGKPFAYANYYVSSGSFTSDENTLIFARCTSKTDNAKPHEMHKIHIKEDMTGSDYIAVDNDCIVLTSKKQIIRPYSYDGSNIVYNIGTYNGKLLYKGENELSTGCKFSEYQLSVGFVNCGGYDVPMSSGGGGENEDWRTY